MNCRGKERSHSVTISNVKQESSYFLCITFIGRYKRHTHIFIYFILFFWIYVWKRISRTTTMYYQKPFIIFPTDKVKKLKIPQKKNTQLFWPAIPKSVDILKKEKKKLEKPQWTAEGQIASEQSEQHLKTMEKECRRPQSRLTMQMGSWVARLLFFFLFVSFTAIHKEQEKRRRTKPNGLECRPSISFPPPFFFSFV